MAEQETIFDRWARERNITVEEMKAILSDRIEQGLNDPDLKNRAQWEKIPHAGEVPTPEEWLRYAVETLERAGMGGFITVVSKFVTMIYRELHCSWHSIIIGVKTRLSNDVIAVSMDAFLWMVAKREVTDGTNCNM